MLPNFVLEYTSCLNILVQENSLEGQIVTVISFITCFFFIIIIYYSTIKKYYKINEPPIHNF